jgi:hypothetical protein
VSLRHASLAEHSGLFFPPLLVHWQNVQDCPLQELLGHERFANAAMMPTVGGILTVNPYASNVGGAGLMNTNTPSQLISA